MYELGGSPPAGAVHVSATVDPVTVAESPEGASGATSAAAPVKARRVTRAGGHPDKPNVPVVPTCEKHDHETEDAPSEGLAVVGICTTLMPVDGATGE